jgi:hypothetical protein
MAEELEVMAQEILEPTRSDPAKTPPEGAKLIFESSQRWFWDLTTALTRGTAFYFAIMAVLVGYVVTKELPELIAQGVLSLGLITSILFAIALTACVRVLLGCIAAIEAVRDLLVNDNALNDPRIMALLPSSRRWLLVIMACTYMLTLSFVIGVLVLWLHLPLHPLAKA